jgi:hypothetical protein
VPSVDKAPTLHRLRPTEESRARTGHSGQLQLFASAHWRLMAGSISAPGLRALAPLSHLRQDCRWGLALTGVGANSAAGSVGSSGRIICHQWCVAAVLAGPRPLLRAPDSMLGPGPRLWPMSIIAPVSLPPGPGPSRVSCSINKKLNATVPLTKGKPRPSCDPFKFKFTITVITGREK